mmetsp:Transcript_6629/g.21396  ORF Transcript_6629/g.21396 Transcript_6629/m.21396 type:complete len:108 (+) Transcript_6629:79-402(+)
MGGAAHLSFTTATLLAGGGVWGYVRRKSMPSLIGGLSTGCAMAGSGVLIQTGNDLEGHFLGLATSSLLLGTMGARFAATRKMLPAGAIALLALVSCAYHGKKVNEWR